MVFTGGIGVIKIKYGKIDNIQEITGIFENGFYVNTGVIDWINMILDAPGNLIGMGELKEPVTIDRNLCIRITKLFYINAEITEYPIKDKNFYVNIGLLNFIYRVLKVGYEMIPITDTKTKKEFLSEVFLHPLICSVITKNEGI